MNYDNLLSFEECTNFNALVESMIKRSCIIDYGIVLDSPADGIVNVAVAVADTPQNQFCMTCVLANIASSSITTYVKPNAGDRVLVFYPRMYSPKMFTIPEDENDRTAVLVDESARGYNLACGIAVLMNQYKEASHQNLIKAEDGTISLQLAYNADDEVNYVTLSINADGEISFNSNNNTLDLNKDGELSVGLAYNSDDEKPLVTLDVDKDGALTVKSNDASVKINKDSEITVANTKASASIDKDGAVTITSNSTTKIEIDKNGNITLNAGGKVSIKNSSANLFTILDGILTILNTSLATAGSPASHTVVPSQFQTQQTQLGQLME